MSAAKRKDLPAPDTDVLSRRFSLGAAPEPQPLVPPQPPSSTEPKSTPQRERGEPAGMVRRTYYYAQDAADALAEAVDRIHYDSRGRIPKHLVLAEIVRAGVAQTDRIAARLSETSHS